MSACAGILKVGNLSLHDRWQHQRSKELTTMESAKGPGEVFAKAYYRGDVRATKQKYEVELLNGKRGREFYGLIDKSNDETYVYRRVEINGYERAIRLPALDPKTLPHHPFRKPVTKEKELLPVYPDGCTYEFYNPDDGIRNGEPKDVFRSAQDHYHDGKFKTPQVKKDIVLEPKHLFRNGDLPQFAPAPRPRKPPSTAIADHNETMERLRETAESESSRDAYFYP